MIDIKVVGLDSLSRKIDEAVKFNSDLDGEIATLVFSPIQKYSNITTLNQVLNGIFLK